jgi:hypothetical protein
MGISLIADHRSHLGRNESVGTAVDDCLQVTATAADQYYEPARYRGFSQ